MKKRTVLNWCLALVLVVLLGVRWKIAQADEELQMGMMPKVETVGMFLVGEKKALVKGDKIAETAKSVAAKISGQAALVLDKETKQVLFGKNVDLLLYPASTTKIITALVAREIYDLEQVITISQSDLARGNNLGVHEGETWRVRDLLASLLIASANEAGTILANHSPWGYDDFIERMNKKARALGMKESVFINPQGYDATQQKTTVRELSLASLELLRDEELAKIVAAERMTIITPFGRKYQLVSTNQLFFQKNLSYKVKGIKTGTTSLAGEALASLLERDGVEILIVVLSAQNRYNDTVSLADFVFDNYVWQEKTSLP